MLLTLFFKSKTKSKAKIGVFDLKSEPWGQSLKPPFFFQWFQYGGGAEQLPAMIVNFLINQSLALNSCIHVIPG